MANIYDVKGSELVKVAAQRLKEKMKKPEYIIYAKSGAHRERPPQDPDFYFVRSASILRQIYVNGPVGTERLRTRYGTRLEHNGTHRHHHQKAGGSLIRESMQALEALNFIKKTKKGRIIAPAGKAFLDRVSKEIAGDVKS
jgi:small subunit ribosomal protein S19e